VFEGSVVTDPSADGMLVATLTVSQLLRTRPHSCSLFKKAIHWNVEKASHLGTWRMFFLSLPLLLSSSLLHMGHILRHHNLLYDGI